MSEQQVSKTKPQAKEPEAAKRTVEARAVCGQAWPKCDRPELCWFPNCGCPS